MDYLEMKKLKKIMKKNKGELNIIDVEEEEDDNDSDYVQEYFHQDFNSVHDNSNNQSLPRLTRHSIKETMRKIPKISPI